MTTSASLPEDEKQIASRLEIFISSHPSPAARDLATKIAAAFDALLASERLARHEAEQERDQEAAEARGAAASEARAHAETRRIDELRLVERRKREAAESRLAVLETAVKALDAAAADDQPYAAWDAAKWAVFNAAVRAVREPAVLETARQEPHEEKQG